MRDRAEVVDLRSEPENRLALAAMSALGGLSSGGARRLLTRDDPALLMANLNLQARDALAWVSSPAQGHWETLVRLARDAASPDVIDALVREHRAFDGQLGRALRCLNGGDVRRAAALIAEFSDSLRRHMQAENEVLAPALGPAPGVEALDIMLREHAELLQQLAAVEEALGGEAWELEAYVALLSGTLAKHEQREESGLFPLWRARLAALDPDSRAAIARRFAR